MQQATAFSKLMAGQAVPSGTVSQEISPGSQGQFQNSPLMNVASIASLLASLANPQTAQNAVKNLTPTGSTTTAAGATPLAGATGGHFVMADGGAVYNSYGVQVN
jgi:hypothetical protein